MFMRGLSWTLSVVVAFTVCGRLSEANAESLRYPLSAAVTKDGTVFLADRNLPGIWRLKDGKLEVFFQASKKYRTPLNAVRCVALDADGKLLAGDSATRDVYRFDEAGHPTPLTGGGIGIPMDIAVAEDGSLRVSDLELHRIWKVPAKGGKPEKWADIRAPRGIATAADGSLWVLSRGDNQVVRITADGKQQPILKGQPLPFPQDIVFDDQGVAYISDNYSRAVWKLEAGKPPTKWIDGDPLVNPVGLARKGPNLLVVDPRVPAVFEVTVDKKISKLPIAP